MKPFKKTKEKIDGKMMSLYGLLFLLGKFILVLPYVTLPEFRSLNKANIDCKIKELESNNIIDKLFFFEYPSLEHVYSTDHAKTEIKNLWYL